MYKSTSQIKMIDKEFILDICFQYLRYDDHKWNNKKDLFHFKLLNNEWE